MIRVTKSGKVPSEKFIKLVLERCGKIPKTITVYAGKNVISREKLLEIIDLNSIVCIVGGEEEQFLVKYIKGIKNLRFKKFLQDIEENCSYDELYNKCNSFII